MLYSVRFLTTSFVVFITLVLILGYLQFSKDKEYRYQNIDQKLQACAENGHLLLGDNFFQIATQKDMISPKEDFENIKKLSKLAKNSGVIYVYSMILKNGKIHFTSSSATNEELKTGHNLTRYFDIYDDASAELKKAFEQKIITSSEYSDKWGTFRSVFIPKVGQNGEIYVLGADIELDQIKQDLQNDFVWLSIKIIAILLFGFLLFFWQLMLINKSLLTKNKILDEQQTKLTQQVENLKIAKSKIKKNSLIDELTQIQNRKSYNHKIDESFSKMSRYQEPFCIAMFDLDNFKKINDTYGHHIGDVVLQKISQKVASTIRSTDYVFRVGGEEFIIILTQTTIEEAFLIAQRVRFEISQMSIIDNEIITISIGVTEACSNDNAISLYNRADGLMYQAKQNGKNQVAQ